MGLFVGLTMLFYTIGGYIVYRSITEFVAAVFHVTVTLIKMQSFPPFDLIKALVIFGLGPVDYARELFYASYSFLLIGLVPVGIILTLLVWSAQAAWWAACLTTVLLFVLDIFHV